MTARLPYQFYYDKNGFRKYEPGNEPNPAVPNEAITYDDGTNPRHYQQQVVARISVP